MSLCDASVACACSVLTARVLCRVDQKASNHLDKGMCFEGLETQESDIPGKLEKFKAIRFECGETVGECKPYPVPLRSSPLRKGLTARAPTQAGLARRTVRASRW